MKQKIRALAQGKRVQLQRGKKTDSQCLEAVATLAVDEKRAARADGCMNRVLVPESVTDALQGQRAVLVNPANGKFTQVRVAGAALSEGRIRATGFVLKALDCDTGAPLMLCCCKKYAFSRIRIQKSEMVKEEAVMVPQMPETEEMLRRFSLFEVFNPLTEDTIFIRSRHIAPDAGLKEGEIRISHRHRSLLGENVPCRLTKDQWQKAMDMLSGEAEMMDALEKVYMPEGDRYTLSQPVGSMAFGKKELVKGAVKKCFGEQLILRPVLHSFHVKSRRSPLKWLCDFFVGKSVLSLSCRRPHMCDETADIVRMTEDNMRYMGLECMDKVILQYRQNRVSCHVMPLEEDKFLSNNVASMPELTIGIPAHIRNRMGIPDLQSAVKVERDTGFILRKSINEQLVPALLTLVSLSFFDSLTIWQKVLLSLAAIPVILYFNLSSKRNMCGK